LLELIQAELERGSVDRQFGRGVVLSGGGSKLGGLAALTEQTLGMPVRIGVPAGMEKMGEVFPDPVFTTAAGLVVYGYHQRLAEGAENAGWTEKIWGMLTGGKTAGKLN